jgi:hypothetical protein
MNVNFNRLLIVVSLVSALAACTQEDPRVSDLQKVIDAFKQDTAAANVGIKT